MLTTKDIQTAEAEAETGNEHVEVGDEHGTRDKLMRLASRQIYYGSLLFNFGAYMLPAL